MIPEGVTEPEEIYCPACNATRVVVAVTETERPDFVLQCSRCRQIWTRPVNAEGVGYDDP